MRADLGKSPPASLHGSVWCPSCRAGPGLQFSQPRTADDGRGMAHGGRHQQTASHICRHPPNRPGAFHSQRVRRQHQPQSPISTIGAHPSLPPPPPTNHPTPHTQRQPASFTLVAFAAVIAAPCAGAPLLPALAAVRLSFLFQAAWQPRCEKLSVATSIHFLSSVVCRNIHVASKYVSHPPLDAPSPSRTTHPLPQRSACGEASGYATGC